MKHKYNDQNLIVLFYRFFFNIDHLNNKLNTSIGLSFILQQLHDLLKYWLKRHVAQAKYQWPLQGWIQFLYGMVKYGMINQKRGLYLEIYVGDQTLSALEKQPQL